MSKKSKSLVWGAIACTLVCFILEIISFSMLKGDSMHKYNGMFGFSNIFEYISSFAIPFAIFYALSLTDKIFHSNKKTIPKTRLNAISIGLIVLGLLVFIGTIFILVPIYFEITGAETDIFWKVWLNLRFLILLFTSLFHLSTFFSMALLLNNLRKAGDNLMTEQP